MNIFEITLFGITIAPTYYGLMYVLGFLAGYYIIKKRISPPLNPLPSKEGKLKSKNLDDLLLYIVLGVILGGRLGYVVFYNFMDYLSNPLDILKVWEGGMSFHGGVIGVIIAMYLFARRYKISFLKLSDEITAVLPIGLGLGRIGNYLNKELLGFSPYYGPFSVNGHFPSPLLEAILEGAVLFIILNWVYRKPLLTPPYQGGGQEAPLLGKEGQGGGRFNGQIAVLFLILYGIFRIIIEIFFRIPDSNLGYIAGYFTMGTILSIPMIIAGIYYYIKFSGQVGK